MGAKEWTSVFEAKEKRFLDNSSERSADKKGRGCFGAGGKQAHHRPGVRCRTALWGGVAGSGKLSGYRNDQVSVQTPPKRSARAPGRCRAVSIPPAHEDLARGLCPATHRKHRSQSPPLPSLFLCLKNEFPNESCNTFFALPVAVVHGTTGRAEHASQCCSYTFR